VSPLFSTFVFQGIFLHRWAAKWGSRRAILALCLLAGVMYYTNIIGGISLVLVYTLLYIKSRTLIVPFIAYILQLLIYLFWDLFDFFFTISSSTKTVSVLEQFRSEWRVGVFFFVLSAPWIVHFIYKNWPSPNEQLPYFANTSE
jgi:membrane protease YdiL (CAAX protease family)